MDARTTASGSLAFRIVGWLLGVLTLGYALFFTVTSLVSDDPADRIHRFHNVAGLVGGGLIGVFSIVFVLRPDWLAVLHALVGQTLAWVIAGLMGGDLFSGLYFVAVVGLILLVALHPDRNALRRLPGRPSIALLTYALIVTIPAWIYAVSMAELQHGPATDPHVEFHHWSSMASASLGIAGLLFSDLAGAPGTGWSWIAIAAGIGFWLLAQVEASRRSTPT